MMIVNDREKLNSVIPALLSCNKPTIDVLVTGDNFFGNTKEGKDMLVSITVYDGKESYYFPFRHAEGENAPLALLSFFGVFLNNDSRVYECWDSKTILHALRNDNIGMPPNNIMDGMLGLHLFSENEESLDIRDVRVKYQLCDPAYMEGVLYDGLKIKCKELGLKVGNSDMRYQMYLLPPEVVAPYACKRAEVIHNAVGFLTQALMQDDSYEVWQQVNLYAYVTAKMEEAGFYINTETLDAYAEEAEMNYSLISTALSQEAGNTINPMSSEQICGVFGIQTSSKDVLQSIAEEGSKWSGMAQKVLDARAWKSVCSRYYSPYRTKIDRSGALHCTFDLTGTYTGRSSCSNPNLQAVAKKTDVFKVKDIFEARAGYTLIQADYKQAELRLATFYIQDEELTNLFESGADLHDATAEALNMPRHVAKQINFSVIYGVGAGTLAKIAKISEDEAKEYIENYHVSHPGFRALTQKCEDIAAYDKRLELWSGRKRHFRSPKDVPHKAMANLIQGGVAEIVRVAATKLHFALQDIGGRLILQVHDSLIAEVPDNSLSVALPLMYEVMCDFPFTPSVDVDMCYGKCWGEMEDWRP